MFLKQPIDIEDFVPVQLQERVIRTPLVQVVVQEDEHRACERILGAKARAGFGAKVVILGADFGALCHSCREGGETIPTSGTSRGIVLKELFTDA